MTATADPRADAGAAPGDGPAGRRVSPALVRGLCLATLLANCAIVLTGSAVRLTGSGLGCPTWPRCTESSYVATAEYGVHGAIEFGNRLLTFVLTAVVVATFVAVVAQRPRRPALVRLAAVQPLGILAQAVLGGVTVLTGLNPWTVSAHFLLSIALIYAAYALFHRSGESDGPRRFLPPVSLVWMVRATVTAAAVVIVLGTVVTGSGPHAGDEAAARTGFDPAAVSQAHADAVFLLLGLTLAAVLATRGSVRRAAAILLGVELAQGAVGYAQYVTDLPVLLVGLHVLGAVLLWLCALRLLFATRTRA